MILSPPTIGEPDEERQQTVYTPRVLPLTLSVTSTLTGPFDCNRANFRSLRHPDVKSGSERHAELGILIS